jgi:hypothetical protein
MSYPQQENAIAVLPKNSQEELRVLVGTFKGRRLCHVRTFLRHCHGKDHDPPLPTKKGIAIRIDLLPDLIAALQKAWANEGIRDVA